MDNCLAIITARGGSKRIPRKNIKSFLGQPIIRYSINAAVESSVFDEIMVSTDDLEIAEIANSFGAKTPFFRSQNTADDFATTADVIHEVLTEYKQRGREFKYCCCIYPTAPFVTASKLKTAYAKIIDSRAKSLIPVVKFNFPVLRSLKITDGKIEYNWPDYEKYRSQDLPSHYHDCGQFYFLEVENFLKTKKMFTEFTISIELNEAEVQDIDTFDDWAIAEMKYSILLEKNNEFIDYTKPSK
jgi:N-acylneuraminate cytidylyltransferase